jgi:hypothetical protein
MPSLHFGYSLLIGLSIMQLPIAHPGRVCRLRLPFLHHDAPGLPIRIPSLPKALCLLVGFSYPFTILVAIVSTANHFILDAIIGSIICLVALRYNELMLNFLPIEDCVCWCLRLHKPVQQAVRLPLEGEN